MPKKAATYHPARTLILFLCAVAALAVWAFWPSMPHTPKLGLDLQGGTQVTLLPKPTNGADLTKEQLNQTVSIIRQRVNGLGVAEAEVTVQGSGPSAVIVVSVPGSSQQQITDQLKQTAQLEMRAVLDTQSGQPAPPPDASATSPTPTPTPSPTKKPAKKPRKGSAAAAADTPPTAPTPAAPSGVVAPVQASEDSTQLRNAYAAVDCSNPDALKGGTPVVPGQYLVTCSKDGSAKYLLAPAFIKGTEITDATAGLPSTGAGGWQVNLTFDSDGAKALADTSTKLYTQAPPANQFAIVLDGLVESSPYFSEPILGGSATINGNFTAASAQAQAQVLKYGALPVSLSVGEVTTVSPTLGADQLKAGLIAGALGIALVTLYLLFAYRLLGLVAIASLGVFSVITYCGFVLMGSTMGLALTLAGVSGAIVSVGIAADSFIVYFERMRDEIRDGTPIRSAADRGWRHARRTILAADFVSILAASILYYLSVGNVRGFAFVLGITTVIDVAVAFWFTRPIVELLAKRRWFNRTPKRFTGTATRADMRYAAQVAEWEAATADTAPTPHPKRVRRRKPSTTPTSNTPRRRNPHATVPGVSEPNSDQSRVTGEPETIEAAADTPNTSETEPGSAADTAHRRSRRRTRPHRSTSTTFTAKDAQ